MPGSGPLEVYLNDHLAGAAAGVALIATIRGNNEAIALDAHLTELGAQVEADRDTLVRIMEALGVTRSMPKQAGGKVVERLSRLRLNKRVTGSAEVSRLMELEALALGVEGKLGLWRTLESISPDRPALADFDLAALVERATAQRAGLEPYRLEAARQAFIAS